MISFTPRRGGDFAEDARELGAGGGLRAPGAQELVRTGMRQPAGAVRAMIRADSKESLAMASIEMELRLAAAPEAVWDVVRDVGAVHTRFAPGFVTDVAMEADGGARMVTFGNGFVAREVIVALDEARRRLAYSVRSERIAHHNASFQVFAAPGGGSRLVWIADVLPEAAAATVEGMMREGLLAAKKALDGV